MAREQFWPFIVDFSDEAVTPLVFRMCPYCGDVIHDTQGQPPSGFPVHLGNATPKHKENQYWIKMMRERKENEDKIKDL